MTNGRDKRQRSALRLPLWAVGTLAALGAVLLILFLFISGRWLFNTVWTLASEAPIVAQPEFDAPTAQENAQGEQIVVSESGETEVILAPEEDPIDVETLEEWQGTERVTVLLLGIDQRCGEEGPVRTDTLIVVTVDPVNKTAGMLSLPRDLWVEIPGFGAERINQAHYFGEGFEYPGGGPALAVDTAEAILGIDINYYATVNFDAFRDVVDLVGGIEIEVPERIEDLDYPDECYGYDPFVIDSGKKVLDGETALKYARTRATEGGDVDRANRQQQVLLALQAKALGQITELLIRAPQLWATFEENVETSMTLDEALQLALLVRDIPPENINRAVIDYNDVYVETTPDGQDILVPIRENIRAIRDELFATPALPPIEIDDLIAQMEDEEAKVAVYNGTAIFGLAGETQTYLNELGVDVVEIGNADSSNYVSSQIIEYGNYPYTVRYLVELMDVPPLNTSQGQRADGNFDILVIIGNDWQIPDE